MECAAMAADGLARVTRTCPVCGGAEARALPRYSHPDWPTVRCTECGFVYLAHAPVYEALSEDLAWTQQAKKEKKRRKEKQPFIQWLDDKTRWRLHMIRPDEWGYIARKIAPGGAVLDVGCGPVNHVPAQFTPFGIEIEKAAAERADAVMREKGGFAVHAPALEGFDAFEEASLDGIIMRSYLEHEARPRDVLEIARRKLRPGGAIYVKVPNYATLNRLVRGRDWCGFRFPDHLNYFDLRSLRRLAKGAGYRLSLINWATRLTNDNVHVFLEKAA